MSVRDQIVILCLCLLLLVGGLASPPAFAAPESRTGSVEKMPAARTGPLTPDEKKKLDYELRAAKEFASRQHWDAAVLSCQEVLKLDSVNVEAFDVLSKVLVSMGNWAYTIKTLQNLVRVAGTNVVYARTLIQVCEAYDMPIQESAALEALVKLEPKNVQAYERLAELYGRLYQPKEVVRAHERAMAVAPDDPRVLRNLADAYVYTSQNDKRIKLMERLVRLQPENEENVALLARLYVDSDDPVRSLAVYKQLLAKHPGDQDYERQLPEVYYSIGNMYFDHSMYTRALKYYEMAKGMPSEDDRLQKQTRYARKLLHPSIAPLYETGRTGANTFDFTDGTLAVPLHDMECTLRLTQARRYVRDSQIQTAAGTDLTKLAAEYRIWKGWRVTGMVGTSSHGPVGSIMAGYSVPNLELNFGYNRNFVFETPLSISTGLAYSDFCAEANWTATKRVNFGLELYVDSYTNGNNAWLSNAMVGYSVIQKPDVFNLTLRYLRSDFHNKFAENPLLRFGPKTYGTDNFALIWEHRPARDILYSLEYVKSFDNNGQTYNSYRARTDVQVGVGTTIFAQYEKGAAATGSISSSSFNATSDHRTTVGAQVTF